MPNGPFVNIGKPQTEASTNHTLSQNAKNTKSASSRTEDAPALSAGDVAAETKPVRKPVRHRGLRSKMAIIVR